MFLSLISIFFILFFGFFFLHNVIKSAVVDALEIHQTRLEAKAADAKFEALMIETDKQIDDMEKQIKIDLDTKYNI